jgi:signal transduction histidine kinase
MFPVGPRIQRITLPAPIVLGVLAGVICGLTALGMALPMAWILYRLEDDIGVRTVAYAAMQVASHPADAPDADGLGVTAIYLDRRLISGVESVELPDPVCDGSAARVLPGRVRVGCAAGPQGEVAALQEPSEWWWLAIAVAILFSGGASLLITLSVSLVLKPVSDAVRALARIEGGERGVRLPGSRLAELDELIRHVNTASAAVDDREHAIAARLRTAHDLARMVAHEIRNPLQTLELLTSLVASEEDPSERTMIAGSIHEEIRALDQVVNRVLRGGLSGVTLTLQRQRRSLVPLIDQVVALRRAETAQRGIELLRGDVTYRPAEIDPALIGRCIENLVVNAVQALGEHGGVVIVSSWEEGDQIALAVDDNGPGVDPALGISIFEADVSTKATGTGLGLALVKSVAEAHNGSIEHLPSELGGARFVLRVPIVARGEENKSSAAAEHPGR